MKKIVYVFLVLSITATINYAQEEESGLIWGARLGLNYSSLGGEDAEGYDVKTGAVFSLFTRVLHFDNFYLQPEISYTSKGVTDIFTIENREYEFILAFTYIEVPVLLKYNFGIDEGNFKPELFVGPFGAININSEITMKDDRSGNAINIKDVKGLDYGIAFGAGFGVAIDNVDFLFELRYTYSLSKYDNSSYERDLNHRVFALSLGFAIN